MKIPNLGETVKVTVLSGPVAAGQTEIDSTALDMANYDGVMIFTLFGAITAGSDVDIAIQEGATASPTTVVTAAAQAVADTDDTKVFLHDIRADKVLRYIRVVVTRTTQDAALGGIIAVQYGARDQAPTNGSTVGALKQVVV